MAAIFLTQTFAMQMDQNRWNELGAKTGNHKTKGNLPFLVKWNIAAVDDAISAELILQIAVSYYSISIR